MSMIFEQCALISCIDMVSHSIGFVLSIVALSHTYPLPLILPYPSIAPSSYLLTIWTVQPSAIPSHTSYRSQSRLRSLFLCSLLPIGQRWPRVLSFYYLCHSIPTSLFLHSYAPSPVIATRLPVQTTRLSCVFSGLVHVVLPFIVVAVTQSHRVSHL